MIGRRCSRLRPALKYHRTQHAVFPRFGKNGVPVWAAIVDQQIIDMAGHFYRRWNPANGTDVNDAILAATAAQNGGKIDTLNVKHFPMPDVSVQKAWKV